MFGVGKIKAGSYVFVVRKENDYKLIITGRVQYVNKNILILLGSYIKPIGLLARKDKGRLGKHSLEVLNDPDPNNCIFILLDRIETGNFDGEVNQEIDTVMWINEKRFFVLEGWLKENLSDLFADVLYSSTDEQRSRNRSVLIEKMNSLYDRDLKDHVYVVARSTKIL